MYTMMTPSHGTALRITGPLWGKFSVHPWILLTNDWKCTTKIQSKELNRQSNCRLFETTWRSFEVTVMLWEGCHRADDIHFRAWRISLKTFVPGSPVYNKQALAQKMTWHLRWLGCLVHICFFCPRWLSKRLWPFRADTLSAYQRHPKMHVSMRLAWHRKTKIQFVNMHHSYMQNDSWYCNHHRVRRILHSITLHIVC